MSNMQIIPNESEINDVLNKCVDLDGRSQFFGMTYEQGVEAALRWIIDGDENPLQE